MKPFPALSCLIPHFRSNLTVSTSLHSLTAHWREVKAVAPGARAGEGPRLADLDSIGSAVSGSHLSELETRPVCIGHRLHTFMLDFFSIAAHAPS